MNFVFAREAQEAVKTLSWWKKFRMRAFRVKILAGHETSEDSEARSPLYLFWCKYCKHYAKDRPHNNIPNRRLECSFCGIWHDFNPCLIEWAILLDIIKFAWTHRRA